MKAIVCTAEDKLSLIDFDESTSSETIRSVVDGRYDCVHLPTLNVDMWINDEGKLDGLAINAFGTALWVLEYGITDMIVGNVLITDGPDNEGYTKGMKDEKIVEVLRAAQSVMLEAMSN